MIDSIVLQVGETRFAINSSLPSFERWLREMFSGFLTQEAPQLTCNLHFNYSTPERGSDRSLSIVPAGKIFDNGQLDLQVISLSPTDYFWLILQVCLRYAFGAKRPQDILLHASGVMHEGKAYIFTGVSGAGKSTVCKLLAPDPSFTILHDEAVAVSFDDNHVSAWSTPLRGEIGNRYSIGAPLQAIFFLNQDLRNYTHLINRKKVAELLCYSFITPKMIDRGGLLARQAPSLEQLLALAEYVPAYELHFRPEASFWDCISRLSEDESVSMKREEKIYVK